MGKISSLIEFTGRTGNVVGVKGDNGEFYLRRHTRHVHDASSMNQVEARAKIALAGSLSKLFGAELLYGMSGNGKRGRRRHWICEIMKHMDLAVVDDKVVATLSPENMILSEGQYAYGVAVSNAAIVDGNVSMDITIPEKVERVLVVSAFADSANGRFMSVDSIVATESGSVSIPVPEERQKVANIYLVPIVRSTSPSGMSYSSEVGASGTTTISYSAEARMYNSEVFEWRHSIFAGTVVGS